MSRGSASGHNAVYGNNYKTVTYNFSGIAAAKRQCEEESSIHDSKRRKVAPYPDRNRGISKFFTDNFHDRDDDDEGESGMSSEVSEMSNSGDEEDTEAESEEDSMEDSETESEDGMEDSEAESEGGI
jgi:hypothetical protein